MGGFLHSCLLSRFKTLRIKNKNSNISTRFLQEPLDGCLTRKCIKVVFHCTEATLQTIIQIFSPLTEYICLPSESHVIALLEIGYQSKWYHLCYHRAVSPSRGAHVP